jgi:hypothetical protein
MHGCMDSFVCVCMIQHVCIYTCVHICIDATEDVASAYMAHTDTTCLSCVPKCVWVWV